MAELLQLKRRPPKTRAGCCVDGMTRGEGEWCVRSTLKFGKEMWPRFPKSRIRQRDSSGGFGLIGQDHIRWIIVICHPSKMRKVSFSVGESGNVGEDSESYLSPWPKESFL
jgi:hypothetical protein